MATTNLHDLSYDALHKLYEETCDLESRQLQRWLEACALVSVHPDKIEALHQSWIAACNLADQIAEDLDRRELGYADA